MALGFDTVRVKFPSKSVIVALLGTSFSAIVAPIAGSGYALGGSWSELLIYAVFILILVFKPTGLFGRGNRRDK